MLGLCPAKEAFSAHAQRRLGGRRPGGRLSVHTSRPDPRVGPNPSLP